MDLEAVEMYVNDIFEKYVSSYSTAVHFYNFVVSSAHDSGAGTEAVLRLSVAVLVRLYQNYFYEIEVSRLKHGLLQA